MESSDGASQKFSQESRPSKQPCSRWGGCSGEPWLSHARFGSLAIAKGSTLLIGARKWDMTSAAP